MTSPSDPLGLVGTTIVEKYAIESIVGQGGFATVFRATHIMWNRPVAVKVFTALGEVAESQRAQLLKDFIQEGALLAELSERSTAICQARDVGMLVTPKGESVPYMVLEWLDGRPLDAILETERLENTALRSLESTVRLLDAVADALALAHSKGIAHRDVKPANIFVLGDHGDGGVKLLDFGIAKVVQDAQKLGFGKTAGTSRHSRRSTARPSSSIARGGRPAPGPTSSRSPSSRPRSSRARSRSRGTTSSSSRSSPPTPTVGPPRARMASWSATRSRPSS